MDLDAGSLTSNHFIFTLEILFCLILRHLQKVTQSDFKKSSLSKCAYSSNFRSINFFSSKKFATNQHEEKKKANANQSVCNIFGGEYNCISLSFQKKKCFLRWNEEWSQRNDEWQEHLEKPHCCKEKDNIFFQSFYLRLWCFCVQFNPAKLFGLKATTIIFSNFKLTLIS